MYTDLNTTSDFLENVEFRNWVISPTNDSNNFWSNYIIQHPEKSEYILSAKNILEQTQLDTNSYLPSEDVVDEMWIQIKANQQKINLKSPFKKYWLLAGVAAAACIILALSWGYKTEEKAPIPLTYRGQLEYVSIDLIEKENDATEPILITLPDSSTVLLQPNSKISYIKNFNDYPKRKVFLTGEAFFKVKEDPSKPFFVYANEIRTKVLGTSFNIKSFENAAEVEVTVKTGKVSVTTLHTNNKNTHYAQKEIILTPNQKLLFSRCDESLKKLLIDIPEIVPTDEILAIPTSYEDAKVTDIFQRMSAAYQIKIIYNKEILKDCLLTASFTSETLYEEINMICKAIEAEFKVEEGNIVIYSRGCH